jgi:hypothetical protein
MLSFISKGMAVLILTSVVNALPGPSALERRESSCSGQGDPFNFSNENLAAQYNYFLEDPSGTHEIWASDFYKMDIGDLRICVSNYYNFEALTYTHEQIAHALSYIFCCAGEYCSDGSATFPTDSGSNLVVTTHNVAEDCPIDNPFRRV